MVMSEAYTQGWMHAKLALVLAMSGIHGWLSRMVSHHGLPQNGFTTTRITIRISRSVGTSLSTR
jgi:uncharacterized membrane protein